MIEAEKANYPIVRMCVWAGVSESGFYHWRRRLPSVKDDGGLTAKIVKIFNESRKSYGRRRVVKQLEQDGVGCSERVVRRVMVENKLVSCYCLPKKKNLTQSDGKRVFADKIERKFTAEEPGLWFVGDITEIKTWVGKTYLATVIDLYNREIVGYSMDTTYTAGLVSDALRKAGQAGLMKRNAVFHSDHGCQYTSAEFQQVCNSMGVVQSMGRVGSCFDNACAESFFASLKKELVHQTVFPTHRHVVRAVTEWIELWYNHKRLHSTNGNISPRIMRQNYNKKMVT